MGNQVKFSGISDELQNLLDADMDNVEARRCTREAFKHIQLSIDHILFKVCCLNSSFLILKINFLLQSLGFYWYWCMMQTAKELKYLCVIILHNNSRKQLIYSSENNDMLFFMLE